MPQAAHLVTVRNATLRVSAEAVEVNGTKVVTLHLADSEERTLDVASYLHPGEDNTVAFTATGKPGGSAVAVIHN